MENHTDNVSRILLFGSPRLGRSIAAILQSRGHVVHRTPSLDGAVELVRRLSPGLVIAAFEPGWRCQVDALEEIAALHPDPPILIVGQSLTPARRTPLPSIDIPVQQADLHQAVSSLLAAQTA